MDEDLTLYNILRVWSWNRSKECMQNWSHRKLCCHQKRRVTLMATLAISSLILASERISFHPIVPIVLKERNLLWEAFSWERPKLCTSFYSADCSWCSPSRLGHGPVGDSELHWKPQQALKGRDGKQFVCVKNNERREGKFGVGLLLANACEHERHNVSSFESLKK